MSTQGNALREQLFDQGVAALERIVAPESPVRGQYVCPLCLRSFPRSALLGSAPGLERDHVPPRGASQGLRINVLTCRTCGGRAGRETERDLRKRNIVMDFAYGTMNTPQQATFEASGQTSAARVHSHPGGVLITEASPEIDWEDHLQGRFQIQLPAPRARRPSIALLKSAYLVAFAKYGYLYIAQPPDLDLVRSQIAAPDSSILDPVPPIFVTPEQHPTNRRLLMIDEPELMLCVHIGRDIVFLPWVDTPQGVYERLASWNQEHQPSEMSFSLSGPWPSEPLYWWDHEMPD